MLKKFIYAVILAVVAPLFYNPFFCRCESGRRMPKYAGRIFGEKVPMMNYYFVKNALIVFGKKWGSQPNTPEEFQAAVWDDLLLSFVAFNANITVSREEFEKELTAVTKGAKTPIDWRADKEAYAKWVKDSTGEGAAPFENQIRSYLQILKLRRQVMDQLHTEVSDKDALDEFRREGHYLSVELVQFDKEEEAGEFYKKAKAKEGFWDAEKKKNPKRFKQPGFVTCCFLNDLWGIPKDALFKMMERDAQDIYPPRPIYKGYGVFKILDKRPADETGFAQAKESYRDKVKQMKKYEGLNEWFKSLKIAAKIQVYYKGGG